jgi:peptide/nickel transport system substrate-binding protein
MRKALLVMFMLLLGCWLVFAGGGEEEVIDIEAGEGPEFEGLADISFDHGWEIGRRGGRVTISTTNDPKTFNNIVADETSTTDITERVIATAVRRNQFTLEWEPWLAESWVISDDQKSITFTLRSDIRWSDGTQITAYDFVDAVNDIYYNEGVVGAGSTRNGLRNAGGDSIWTAANSRVFTVTLPNVYAGIFQLCSVAPLPMHVFRPLVEREGIGAVDSFWGVDTDVTSIVSSGPWIITEYEPSEFIRLEPNPYYYETDEQGAQLPYLSEVVFRILPDQDTQLQAFIAGDLSYLNLRGEDFGVLVDRKEELECELYNVGPAASTNFITFNQNPIEGDDDAGIGEPQITWLSNKTFRHAISALIDRRTYINNIAYGFGYPQYSLVPTFSPYYWEEAPAHAITYDPILATELLDSIDYVDRDGDGWREDPDGNKISLVLSTNSDNSDRVAIVSQIAQEAATVGIEITPNPVDFNSLVGQLVASYDWELVVIGLTGSLDPISGANVFPSSGNLHMIEPNQETPRRDWEVRVDEAWDIANLTTDEDQRKRGFQVVQEVWLEESPWTFTFNNAVLHAYRDYIGNIYPHPVENYDWEGILHRLYIR